MKKTSLSAQHYLECDNCEGNPAAFHCTACVGHLCVKCKREHEKKKITKNHAVVPLKSNIEDMVYLQHCTKHTQKKLECFCDSCRMPVCTDCIINSHNGHSLKSLSKDNKEITDLSTKVKQTINTDLVPKYKYLLDTITTKKQALTKSADEIEQEIQKQTRRLVKVVLCVSEQIVQHVRNEEREGQTQIDNTKKQLAENLSKLETMDKMIGPTNSLFDPTIRNELETFRSYLTNLQEFEYKITFFRPGNAEEKMEIMFGNWPELQIIKVSLIHLHVRKYYHITFASNYL